MSNELAVFTKPGDLMAFLERGKSAVAMALPSHLKPDRMLRLALTAFSTTPALRSCTGQSILASIVVASQLGLEPGVAGQAYLIPYGKNCTLVPGWQGLVGLLNNSGRATAWTGAVFEGDDFSCSLGSNPHINHIPGPNSGDDKKLIGAYACGKVNGSEMPVIEFWKAERIWKHRDKFNKVGVKHYSFQHPEMYARKVVLLQVLKYMPRSIELNNALTAANATEKGFTAKVEDGVVIEVPIEQEMEPARVGNRTEGKSVTEMAAEEKAGQTAEQREEYERTSAGEVRHQGATEVKDTTPKQSGPSLESLTKTLRAKARDLQMGPSGLVAKLIEHKFLNEEATFETLSADAIAEVLASWPEFVDKLKNPGESA